MRKEKQSVDGIIGNRKHSKMEENKPRKKMESNTVHRVWKKTKRGCQPMISQSMVFLSLEIKKNETNCLCS